LASNLPPTVTEVVTSWARGKKVFDRNKVPIEKKVQASILCTSGFSYRAASKLMGGVSYVAVRDAYYAMSKALPRPERKHRRCIAIDESHSRVNGEYVVFWLARDVDSGELLTFRCSLTGSPEDGAKFVASVLEFCANRPLVRVGRGPNYPRALKNLDLQFQIETTPINESSIKQKIGKWFLGT
jgi:putative transposase